DGALVFDSVSGLSTGTLAATPDGEQLIVSRPIFDIAAYLTTSGAPSSLGLGITVGSAERTNSIPDGGPGTLALAPNGSSVYLAGAGTSGSVSTLLRNPHSADLALAGASFNDLAGAHGLSASTALAVSADGEFLYVCDYAQHAIAVLRADLDLRVFDAAAHA